MSTRLPFSAPPSTAPQVFLGISAKSLHIQGNQRPQADFSQRHRAKADRFELTRVAQSILYDKEKPAAEQKRVCWCHRNIIGADTNVSVFRAVDGSSAHFAGVTTCGSVWHCPVCAAKVAEARRAELQQGMVAHVHSGGAAYLLTLTFPHEADHDLGDMLERFDKARQSWRNARKVKAILGAEGEAGVAGSVSSLEVTVSMENGWHPHLHLLVFADRNGLGEISFDGTVRMDEEANLGSPAIDRLKAEWVRILRKVGLGDDSKITWMMERALNVRGGEMAAEYIAKFGRDERWGQSSELTRNHAKIGKAGRSGEILHFTPFQLLAWASQGDGWAYHRFREYAEAFEGKRMLSWSRGLKKRLLGREEERTDEELAAAQAPETERSGGLTEEQYGVLLSRNKLGDLLRYVAENCTSPDAAQADINDFVDSIRPLPPTHSAARRIKATFDRGPKYGGIDRMRVLA